MPGRSDPFAPTDTFVRRHVGPGAAEEASMLASLGYDSLDAHRRHGARVDPHAARAVDAERPR
jgi:glycine cleavage system pyridoxal-binding protein P